jgi:two-component sensor histidine kinase
VYAIADGLAAWQVFRLFEDSHGNIWVSTIDAPTTNGLARWEPSVQRLRNLAHVPGLPSFKEDLARSFGADRSGNVWIGFNEALVRYANGAFTTFTGADGLPPGEIKDIHVDRSGRIWLASDQSGLVRVDQSGAARPVFVKYTTAQGLSGNSLNVITDDREGRIFAGGGSGLDRFDPATGNVKHFSVADGLAPGTFQAAFRDHAGILWFGTSEGLARLAPEPETLRPAPPIWITGLRATGVSKGVSAVGEREVSLPDFSPDQRELQIEFVALSFAPGEVLRYQYRLDGAAGDWSVPTERRSVTYVSLSPGHYRFQVHAVNSDGTVSLQPATVTFTVLRPLWLRWWFLALFACALTTMTFALYRYRIGRLLEVANIRTRIASDLHDDIGANLTRIALLSEVARAAPGAGSLDAPLAAIARIPRESVSSMSDIVWAIKPERESLLDLTRRLRQHADEVFAQRGVELRFNAPGAERLRLGVGVRRDVLLVFKEAVNNAVRHSRCSRIQIDLRLDGRTLVLELADNGVGFDPAAKSEGHGLTSLRRRGRRLGGSLAVTSSPGAGTRILLTIPI